MQWEGNGKAFVEVRLDPGLEKPKGLSGARGGVLGKEQHKESTEERNSLVCSGKCGLVCLL